MPHTVAQKSVYVLCTGGTITMQRTADGYKTESGYLQAAMEKIPEIKNADMPSYTIDEFEVPIDSANMTPADWILIAEKIQENYQNFDGFVILHGTDTMAYTASALSFMLENLNKPVVITGSQLPLFQTRSDARDNLINAILIASTTRIPEVCIYFNNKLFRGNRSKKMDADSFSAFVSPNYPALGKIGREVVIRHHLIRKPPTDNLKLQLFQSVSAGALRIFPGISLDMLKHFLRPPLQALILETFGLGTAPENPEFLNIIRQAVDAGMIIVNCSQCAVAKVRMKEYAAGTALYNAGVISGGDMTAEAAIAKLYYLFSKNLPLAEIKTQMALDLRGERTVSP